MLTGHGLVDPALERDEQPPAAWTDGGGGPRRAARRVPRAAAAGGRVRGVHLGVHRRSAAPGADRPPARDPRPAPPRLAGGDGPALRPRRPLPGRIGRARRRRPDRPPVRRRHDLAAGRRRVRPLPHAAAGADRRAVRRRQRRARRARRRTARPPSTSRTCRWSTSSRCPSRRSVRRSPRSSWSPWPTRCRSSGPATRVVVLSGSGDGLIDAAAAGLIVGDEAIRYSASMSGDELADAVADRRRWSSSPTPTGDEPTTGAARRTSPATPSRHRATRPCGRTPATPGSTCSPTPTRPPTRCRCRTARCRCGRPATGSASATSPRPARRWPSTATRTRRGRCSIRTGQYLEITTTTGVDHVTLLQPDGLGDVRRLGHGHRSPSTAARRSEVALDERSLDHRAAHRLPGDRRADDDPHRARPDRRAARTRPRPPDRTPVGFAELDAGIGQSPEWIVVPSDLTTAMRDGGIERPVTYVLTRERVRPTNRWRADPGVAHRQAARRAVRHRRRRRGHRADRPAGAGRRARRAARASPGRPPTARLTGVPAAGGWAAADGDDDTAWITPFDEVVGAALHAELVDPDAAADAAPAPRRLLAGHRRAVDAGRARRSTCSSAPPDDDGVSIDRRSRRVRRRTADDRDHVDRPSERRATAGSATPW